MPDNQPSRSARLFGVAQGDEAWERELRRTLAEQAGRVRHPASEVAGSAIARARRIRRRRNVIGLATVVAGTVLATGVFLQGWDDADDPADNLREYGVVSGFADEEVSSSAVSPPRLAMGGSVTLSGDVDMIGTGVSGGLVLVTTGGTTIDLDPIRDVVSAHRFGNGWAVVSGGERTARLWWVSSSGEPVALLAGMDAIVVSHGQVAWQRGAVLSAAGLSADGELTGQVSTTAPTGGGQPVGFLHEAVLLERTESVGWDTWLPSQGDYQPTWTDDVARVYGPLPGGASVGLMTTEPGAEGSCLARLDAELAVDGSGCIPGQQLPPDAPAAVSPNGHWLLSGAAEPAGSVLVDLDSVFGGAPEAAATPLGTPAALAAPVWLGPDRVLFATTTSLVQLWPDRLRAGADGAVEEIPLNGSTAQVISPV